MEEFSVLRTPAYAKYNGNLSRSRFSDRYGHTLAYYEPVYDIDLKIPGLGIMELPFVPIQYIKKSKGSRPFVSRYLGQEDMIQINLRAERKAKDIMKDFHPAQKASYESVRDFRTRKEIESRMEDIREACANVHSYSRKAEKYDLTRKTLFSPRAKTNFVDKDNLKDIILDAKVEHVNDMRRTLGEDRENHRAKFRLHAAACKVDKVESDEKNEDDVEDETVGSTGRKSSRDVRAEQLKHLQEKLKKQETEADCFERTFGRHLAKLRGEVNSLTHVADDYIADNKYQSFKIDNIFKRNWSFNVKIFLCDNKFWCFFEFSREDFKFLFSST